uniref:probable disease resistance protein At4g27220 n=1 Tax=Fragaria vesca subsp. vesca TaxID=101020 RepID=UPI0005CA44FB|nr:PREDICTED: probable disease resistance protein At4g27220 [Fragaria vesca subsp. vesca]XP_011469109.1 PREDICTED: probable disease resistance protein At4g27220 [Fragaria vesca subsp. vesca]
MGQTTSASIPSSADSVSLTSAAESSSAASASFSSSSTPQSSYDVFLSFRGPDTRQGIVFELYDRLNNTRGVKTFKDDSDLEVGDAISPTLLAAIEQSRFAIVVLSENYAASTWCLEELAKICQCMQDNRILPLFYHVDPTDVRYQKKSFETAFNRHEKSRRHKTEKVKQWRDALNKVANFSGWHTQNYKAERELVDAIVEFVCSKVLPASIQSTGDFHAFEATRQAMDKVMKALKDDKITVIAVHGIGGVGKTTLVEHAGQEAHNQRLFNHVIKIVVTQTLDLRKIQGTLADGLGITLTQDSEDGRASRLNKEIMRKNKLLIIVDDVWERVELASIGVPNYDMLQSCSSKVIFTTRIRNVCHVMGSHEKITLSVLSEEDSWALFVKNAGRSFEPTNFEDVAKKVARECKGLPIALIAVARALGDKELVEWKTAARRLEKSQNANPDDKGVASESVKLSYDYLKDEECKSCFLLCCLFPEDSSIEIEQLFRYAIGKGLFRDANTIEEARGTANSVVNYLKNSSLLMDTGHHQFVKMHDVIRDTAIQIAQSVDGFLVKAGYGLRDWPRLHEDCSAISLMENYIRKLPGRLVIPKLQILLLEDSSFLEEIPGTFFKVWKN